MQINPQGELVTTEGHKVLGEGGTIQFQTNDKDIAINRDGTITVPGGQRGKIRLVQFDNVQRLQKDGSSTFKAPTGIDALPAQNPHVIQGSIEQSNVKSVIEMTRMIEVTRHYTQMSSMLQSHHDMRRGAIDKLAEVPA